MKKRFFEVNGGFCLFLLSVVFFTEFAQAQTITPSNAGPLNSTSLYAVIEGYSLYEYADIKSGNWSSQRSEVWRNSFVHSTLAVGPYYPSGTFGDGNPVLVAYFWGYADNGVTIRRVIPDPVGGNSSIQTFTVSNAGGVPAPAWSGGEVNQLTGEIYFSGYYTATIQNDFRLGVYNPYTGEFKNSGKLVPKTSAETISGNVYSDMAIDADGNAYIMVQGSSVNQAILIRVEIGANGTGWKYSRVRTFTHASLGAATSSWGMAFLHGKLYVSIGANILEINTLTSNVVNKGSAGATYLDLAAAQTAVVIKGTVYNDLDGDGVISQDEKNITASGSPTMAGDTIEVYDSNKIYKGFTTTNSGGEYFLLLDESNTDYYVRLKHPRINGIKSVQTWASAGTVTNVHSNYTVTAYSHDTNGNVIEKTTGGACSGARSAFDNNDPNTNNLDDAMIYSKIHLGYNITGVVDFGITAMSDLGDAPYQSTFAGETTGAAAPVHLTYGKQLYLGNDVTTDNLDGKTTPATGADDPTDDGVWVVLEGKNIALPDTVLEAGEIYTIKVKTSGPKRTTGYLNVFTSCPNSGTINVANMNTAFQTGFKVASNLQSTNTNDTITFTYTVPAGIPQGRNQSYMRFRFSNVQDLNATGNPDPSVADTWWAISGEVEDYRVALRKRIPAPVIATTWPTGASLTYGQSLGQATITGGSVTGITGSFSFKNTDIYPTVANSGVTNYAILFVPADFNNYIPVEKTGGMTVTVHPKTITASSPAVSDKFFDNNTQAWVKNLTFSGLVLGETLRKGTDYTTTGAFANAAVDNGKPVNVTVALNNTPSANNYTLTTTNLSGTASILNQSTGNGVVIGTDNDLNLSYAILDLESKTKGLRLPRLTSLNRDALDLTAEPSTAQSAKGLLFFNADDKNLQYWNGAEWKALDGTVTSWTAGTTALNREPSNVVIGSVANNTDYFALLKIESNSRGIRLPRVRSNIADALTQTNNGIAKSGLLLYNADTNFIQYWNGEDWTELDGSVISATSSAGLRPVSQGVNIGDLSEPPFHSELAFAEATEKAIQLPCLTIVARNNLLTNAVSTELATAAGLIIFNTDTEQLEFFDGTDWKSVE
ncbi:hypothetical protein FACS189437_07450 [Bacteroidia bacterium]|nr:hypothetical protein FACS189437_07450 [Bacteroidia bacterium]